MPPPLFRRSFWYWDRRLHATTITHHHHHDCTTHSLPERRAGIVVTLGWMLSRRKTLAPYTRLYKSYGWDCLVCHPHLFNLFLPHSATTLAVNVLDELAKDLERDPTPVVFAIFSGGHKACFYKIIQILQGKCKDIGIDEGRYEVVVRSVVGVIFDSSPVDFVGELGGKFVSHQVLTFQAGKPISIISWAASAVSKGVDFVFFNQLEPQREELWHALYSSVRMGPILFFCCENDELSPVNTIRVYASNLRKLGGLVDLVVWKESEHVGHFRLFPELYSSKVGKLLTDASSVYTERLQKSAELEGGGIGCPAEPSASTIWTCLPESVASEIDQLYKLSHIRSNGTKTGGNITGPRRTGSCDEGDAVDREIIRSRL